MKEYKDCLEAEDVVAQTIKSFGVWEDLTHQERENMRQMSSLVNEEQLPILKTHFWNEWTSVWNEIPEFARVGEDEMKKNWIRSKGTAALKDFGEKQIDRVISNSCTYPSHRLKVFQDRRIKNIYNTSSLHKKILCNKILFVKNDKPNKMIK